MRPIRNIKKSGVVMEDLAQGVGSFQQARNGQNYTVHKVDVPVAVLTTAEMSALDVEQFTRARVYTSETEYIDYVYVADSAEGEPSTGPGTWVSSSGSAGAIVTYSTDPEPNPANYKDGKRWIIVDLKEYYTLQEGYWVEDGQTGDDVDITAASHLTLAQAQASGLEVGRYVVLVDRAHSLCEVQPVGVLADGYGYIAVNNGTTLKVMSNDGTHNLEWYGAKGGDETFDNRPVIEALFSYLDGEGGEIRVPSKVYYTSPINPNLTNITSVKIIGSSERHSQLKMIAGGVGYVLTADSQRNLKLGIENLTIHGNRANAPGSGGLKLAYQYLEGYKRVTCRDVDSLHCWNLQGCNNNTFDNCTAIYANTGFGFNFQLGTSGQKSIGNTFSSCDVEDVGKRGVYVGSAGRRNTWLSPWIEWRNDSGVDGTNIAIFDNELLNSYLTPTIVNSAPNNLIGHMILLGTGAASTTITGMPNNGGQCANAALEIQGTDNKHFIRGYGSDSSSFNPNNPADFNNANNDTSVTVMVGNTIYGGFNVEADTLSLRVSRDDTVAGTVVTFGNKNVDGLEVFTSDGNLEWGLNVLNSRSLILRTNQQNRIRVSETGEIQLYNIPSTPSTTQYTMWYDPADGNSIKYVP